GRLLRALFAAGFVSAPLLEVAQSVPCPGRWTPPRGLPRRSPAGVRARAEPARLLLGSGRSLRAPAHPGRSRRACDQLQRALLLGGDRRPLARALLLGAGHRAAPDLPRDPRGGFVGPVSVASAARLAAGLSARDPHPHLREQLRHGSAPPEAPRP